MIALGVRNRHTNTSVTVRARYVSCAIWGVVMGLLPGFRVDNAAHLGGLAAGFVIAYVAGTPRALGSGIENLWRILAAICLFLTAISFGIMFLNFAGSYRHIL